MKQTLSLSPFICIISLFMFHGNINVQWLFQKSQAAMVLGREFHNDMVHHLH